MNANIYGRSQIFETEKRKSRKRLGTKTLAGLLAFGLVVGTPSVVLADVQSTMSQSELCGTEVSGLQ